MKTYEIHLETSTQAEVLSDFLQRIINNPSKRFGFQIKKRRIYIESD